MSFKSIELKTEYRSLHDNIPRDFYIPLLSEAVSYKRSVGFFSSSILSHIALGIASLAKNGGYIQMVASPQLSSQDIEAIKKGYDERQKREIIQTALFRELKEPATLVERERLNLLASLIANGTMDIKIAVTKSGMYHEKLGLLEDREHNIVAFSGSPNETAFALEHNYETMDVYTSWADSENRIEKKVKSFNSIWNGTEENLTTIDFPELTVEIIKRYKKTEINYDDYEKKEDEWILCDSGNIETYETFFSFPPDKKPRPHQTKAIQQFVANSFSCLFAMATGTGKTLTALFSANELSRYIRLEKIIIIVPLKDLVDQWEKDIRSCFNGDVITIRSGVEWKEKLSQINILSLLNPNNKNTKLVLITTYDSFCRNSEKILASFNPESSLIIADEVHKFGAETYSKKLPENLKYRIGLSATPKRPYDDKGTQAIFDYFCPSGNVYEFSINDAIQNNMLCHYNYHPKLVHLTDFEMDDYCAISEKISKMSAYINNANTTKDEKQIYEQMLKQRHRIIERATNKKDLFLETMTAEIKKYVDKTIIFCPEGKDECENDLLTIYKTELWQQLVKTGKVIVMSEYVQGTKKEIIERFANGAIDILFAKQRLNEGIDIPEARRAFFIASSTSEREFIQRRGRVLRIADGKKIAEIFDFIVVPPAEFLNSQYAKSIIDNEIKRAMDFAKNADNCGEIENTLKEYL